MKLQALLIAAALAAGSALAAAPNDSAKAPAGTTASTSDGAGASADKAAQVHEKKMGKKAHARHAGARHHAMHARAGKHGHQRTSAMGAGASASSTDLNAQSREQRIQEAYQNWQTAQRR